MSTFPNFNAWHKVPKDADIPARTPYFTANGGEFRGYLADGWDETCFPGKRNPDRDYYTEERIPSPEEEVVEKRARVMFNTFTAYSEMWECEDTDTREAWLDLARKYVEK